MSTSPDSPVDDYLGNYGVKDARREKRFYRITGSVLGAVLLGTILWYYFRTWGEEQAIKQFFANLQSKNYKAAYAQFGCSDASPCRDYSFEKFLEDWGEKSEFGDPAEASLGLVEPCGNMVWIEVTRPNKPRIGLAVDPQTKTVGYAPSVRCPGVWRVRDFPAKLLAYIKRRM